MMLMSVLTLVMVLADSLPILGGGLDWPNITITINVLFALILFSLALVWHMVTRRRGGGLH